MTSERLRAIRLILVDDHALVREGLGRLLELEPDMRVVGSFGDGDAAVRFAIRETPDVAILDVSMPHASGIDVARQLRGASPGTHLLVLSMHSAPEYVSQAFHAGASGYVLKESAGEEVVAAVRSVNAGQRYLSETISLGALEDYMRRDATEYPLERLSRRELQVLKLVVEGNTNHKVAVSLGLSPKSVETYRSRLMAKLGLDDLPALVKFAIRHGITSV